MIDLPELAEPVPCHPVFLSALYVKPAGSGVTVVLGCVFEVVVDEVVCNLWRGTEKMREKLFFFAECHIS